ncbi:MAG: diadenylate cyclase CdaA [Candidatus Gastranaerophilales bacterium]|nr:diadenylate cyclase CdaA [Candidatus Gastranaerophilales bacterium]
MNFWYHLLNLQFKAIISNFDWLSLVELIIVGLIVFAVYLRFIKRSASRKLFNGILSIFFIYIFSRLLTTLHLFILGRFLEGISLILLFSLVVIFQPELRRFLGYLGQPGFIHKTFFAPQKEEETNVDFIKELTDAIKYLSKSKIGALMVIQETEDMNAYSEIGTKLLSVVSSELILTIFHPNTALHDGAMILTPKKILAAGVLLPLTDDPELSWQYGTRHRAAIGITEVCDATCIVVSEETGFVSIAKGGQLKKIETFDMLNTELQNLIVPEEGSKKKKKKRIFKFK